MHAVSALRAPRSAGFTLIELMVGLVILSITLAVGVPALNSWVTATRARAASEFYAEGLRMARAEALKRNVYSRLLLTDNATNGQLDWQVDICLPSATNSCHDSGSSWSSVTAAATTSDASDTRGTDFRSVFKSANGLPPAAIMTLARTPGDATDLYFTPLGWVDSDSSVQPALTKIQIAPSAAYAGVFPASAVAITLAGVVSKCDPTQLVTDSRGCPP